MRTLEQIAEMGLSSDCTLDPTVVMAIMMGGREHPCDRCNMDRLRCRGFQRVDSQRVEAAQGDKTHE